RSKPIGKGRPLAEPPLLSWQCRDRLALRELEAAAGLGAAVLLALDHAAIAGEEAGGLHGAAQFRLELAQGLADAVLDRAGLTRKPAALDGGDGVVLALAVGDLERLVDDQTQRRTGEVDFLLAAVDGDLAGAGLEPDAGDRILAAAGGIGAALRVDFLLAQHGGRAGADDGSLDGLALGGSLGSRSAA